MKSGCSKVEVERGRVSECDQNTLCEILKKVNKVILI